MKLNLWIRLVSLIIANIFIDQYLMIKIWQITDAKFVVFHWTTLYKCERCMHHLVFSYKVIQIIYRRPSRYSNGEHGSLYWEGLGSIPGAIKPKNIILVHADKHAPLRSGRSDLLARH